MNKFIKPFENMKDYLRSVYILVNYTRYSLFTLTSLINKCLNKNFSITTIENLNVKIKSFPEIYGTEFFSLEVFKDTNNIILKKEEIVHFVTPAQFCVFCPANLNNKLHEISLRIST